MSIIEELQYVNHNAISFTGLTVGYVVDTNDPQQMGRVRAVCPALKDPEVTDDFELSDIPWASYSSPFGGFHQNLERGPDPDKSAGPVSYGFWNIPKRGAEVLIACLDGDAQYRVWLGCLNGQFLTHTMPHGRYNTSGSDLDGPLSSTEQPIQPLYDNQTSHFGGRNKFEWVTRGADYTGSALDSTAISRVASDTPDDKGVEDFTGNNRRQGYSRDRGLTDKRIFDNQVYSWTSPGFHAIAMDDRPENCRIRLRTTTGHQIILDDTNERIYLSTSTGKVWVEMDSVGNMDIHTDRYMAFHSGKDMNFSSDGTLRLRGKEGVHIVSDDELRMNSKNDMHFKSDANVRTHAASTLYFQSDSDTHIKSGGNLNTEGSSNVNIKSGGNILQTGSAIHLNGPSASSADAAEDKYAFSTNRVPFKLNSSNDPWSRSMMNITKTDQDTAANYLADYYNYGDMEFPYDSSSAGKIELGESLNRGNNWRR